MPPPRPCPLSPVTRPCRDHPALPPDPRGLERPGRPRPARRVHGGVRGTPGALGAQHAGQHRDGVLVSEPLRGLRVRLRLLLRARHPSLGRRTGVGGGRAAAARRSRRRLRAPHPGEARRARCPRARAPHPAARRAAHRDRHRHRPVPAGRVALRRDPAPARGAAPLPPARARDDHQVAPRRPRPGPAGTPRAPPRAQGEHLAREHRRAPAPPAGAPLPRAGAAAPRAGRAPRGGRERGPDGGASDPRHHRLARPARRRRGRRPRRRRRMGARLPAPPRARQPAHLPPPPRAGVPGARRPVRARLRPEPERPPPLRPGALGPDEAPAGEARVRERAAGRGSRLATATRDS